MENNDQITALAREYAEEQGKLDREQGFPESFIKDMLEFNEKEFKSAIEFLLRRFCLVEKENIKKYFQSRNYIFTHQDKYEVYIVRESEVEMKLLRCLFPEIAKEVEP